MVPQLRSRRSWMATTHPQVTSPTTSTSAPTISWPCPGTSSNTDAVSTPTNRIRASAARPGNPELGSETISCRLMETATNTNPVRTPAAPAWAKKKSCHSSMCRSSSSWWRCEGELYVRASLAVLLGRLLDRRGRLAQVLRAHHGMDLYGRSQPKEKGFHQSGDLGGMVHVDYNV